MRLLASIFIFLATSALSFAAAPATTVTTAAASRLDESTLLSLVARELTTHYSLQGELQLELLRACALPAKPALAWEIRVTDLPASPASNLVLRIQFLGDSQSHGETTLMVRANLWRDAWSTRQAVNVGANFDPAQLATQRVDFLRERDAVAVDATDLNSIYARGVSANRILTQRDLARRPLVRKGDLVEITAIDGALSVTLQALALENGAAGEVVSVRNVESRKTFHATVTDEKRAQIRL